MIKLLIFFIITPIETLTFDDPVESESVALVRELSFLEHGSHLSVVRHHIQTFPELGQSFQSVDSRRDSYIRLDMTFLTTPAFFDCAVCLENWNIWTNYVKFIYLTMKWIFLDFSSSSKFWRFFLIIFFNQKLDEFDYFKWNIFV